MVEFVIPGKPIAKGRPRMAVKGKKAYLYTPEATRNYEQAVYLVTKTKVRKKFTGPVLVEATFYHYVKHQKPDLDNCIKSLLDGMNNAAYEDDSQVYGIVARMVPVRHQKDERVFVRISDLDLDEEGATNGEHETGVCGAEDGGHGKSG